MGAKMDQDEFQSYKAAFDAFDWNHNGKISYASLQVRKVEYSMIYKILQVIRPQ